MELDEARRSAASLFDEIGQPSNRRLTEVGRREGQGLGFFEQLHSMTPRGFPLPQLLHFGFTRLLDLDTYGPQEKLLWGIRFDYCGATFGFEHRKFGLRALCEPSNLDSPLLQEVLGKARALTDIVEVYLKSGFVATQITGNCFTVENLFPQLDARYRFLRERAEVAYSTAPPPPETHRTANGEVTTSDYARPGREGGALGTAAVDAYYSRQEHLFCLASAFVMSEPPLGGFVEFLGGNWTKKARAILDLSDPKTKKLYDRLLDIREEWRNPLAHGGFLSGGGSLYFHLPRVGALPARLRRTPAGVKFGFNLHSESFSEIVKFFDCVDDFLREGPLYFPMKWAESGLDVAFDDASRATYKTAMDSEERFNDFLQWSQYQWEIHANMDFAG